MKKETFDLIELAAELSTSVEELIRFGASGDLTIHVIADAWSGRKEGDGGAESSVIVNGLVELLPSDLFQSQNASCTEVRQVKTAEGDVVVLDSSQQVERGLHFVTAAERDRAREALNPDMAIFGEDLPPYLDSKSEYFSNTLNAAVRAWMAVYFEEEFRKDKGAHIKQIKAWLEKNFPNLSEHAQKQIASVVNFKKEGGR